jgi:hypothetical protein
MARKDGIFIDNRDKNCPKCGKRHARIRESDKYMALLECPDGHQWSVVLKKGA